MTTIAITGAAGHLGRIIIDRLLETVPASDLIAVVRTPEKAADFEAKGLTVRIADYNDASAVQAALVGADKLLLISGTEFGRRVAQHGAIIDAAKANGVGFIAYTSAPNAAKTTLVVAPEHKATEELLAASGIDHALMRNGWYSDGYLLRLSEARATGELVVGTATGRVASAERKDFADAAVAVLTEDGHAGKVYELFGDHAWDYRELADTIGELIGSEVGLRVLTLDELKQYHLDNGLPAATADLLVAIDRNIHDGLLGVENGELSALIGRPTTPIRETLAAAL